jgi:RNA polymerase sigma factor (sigma-70 family)
MAAARLATVLRHIRGLAGAPAGPEPTDAQLLQCFLADRDEAAFRALVERHGRMVLGLCRRVLPQRQDAEDAFQATFLVLATKAASIRKGTALPSWLYGVAYRVARNSRRQATRRRLHERRAGKAEQAEPNLEVAWHELQAVLAEEVGRLPEKYRAVFVLCCLEGHSKREAAQRLGWKEGTASARLAEARKRLQQRLARRGLTPMLALCAGALEAPDATAVAPALAQATVRAALGVAARTATAGLVPARVAALVDGVTRTMFASKAKLLALLVLALGVLAAAMGIRYRQGFAAAPPAEAAAPAEAPKPAAPNKQPADTRDQVTVRGRVLDPNGRPLAGAELILAPPSRGVTDNAVRVVRATSGADGAFHFTVGRAELPEHTVLLAAAPGYGPDWVDAATLGKGDATLHLARDVPMSGRILGLEGRPVKGVTVRVLRLEAPAEGDLTPVLKAWNPASNRPSSRLSKLLHRPLWAGIAPARTDAAGRFRITGLGGERMAVLSVEGPTIAHKVLHVLLRPGLDVKALTRPGPEATRPGMRRPTPLTVYGPTFDHLATPTRPIVGIVRDRLTGRPLAGVAVAGSGAGGWSEDLVTTVTDAHGRYRLVGLPKGPTYHVRAAALNNDCLPAETRVKDDTGLGPLTQDFALVRGVRVRGRVTDRATGKPVRAALWYAPLDDKKYLARLPADDFYKHSILGLRTDTDGNYSLLALPGRGLITFRAEVGGPNPYVQAVLDPRHRKRAYSTDPQDGMGESFLAAGGRLASLLGHNAYALIEPTPGSGPVTVDVQLDAGKTQTCRMVGPNGKPLAGATVAGLEGFGGTTTLKGATFTALALNPARPRTVAAIHPGRKLAGSVVLGGNEPGPVTVRLRPWATLKGRLLDDEGKPLAGAQVRLCYAEYPTVWLPGLDVMKTYADVRTNAAGAFEVGCVFGAKEFALVFAKGGQYRDIGGRYRKLSLAPGATQDLGDIASKGDGAP